MIDCEASDDEIRWYVRGQKTIYPSHQVELAYCIDPNQPDTAEVDCTQFGWPVRRFKRIYPGSQEAK